MKKVNTRRLKFKINNTVVIAFAVVFVILLNMVLSLAEDKFPRMKTDLTENGLTKLTNETKLFLTSLDEGDTEIEIICFKGTNDVASLVKDVLEAYDYYSENITYREENYHKNPTALASFNISASRITDGTVIVTNKDKTRYRAVLPGDMWSNSEFLLESKVTNAISYIAGSESVNVCIATGYGSDDYISSLIQALIDDNLSVSRIDLSTTNIPDGIDLLMIISPLADLTEREIKSIDNFALRGGSLIVALPSYAVSLPNLETYLKYWGISVNGDLIYEYDETDSYEQSGLWFFAENENHAVTDNVKGRILASNARSLNFTPTGDIDAAVLLSSSEKAVSVPQNKEQLTKEDVNNGPFNIGYVLERPLDGSYEKTSKLIVTSTPGVWGVDSAIDVMSESRFGNRQFVSNAISYASGKAVQSVAVPKKSSSENIMTISNAQGSLFTVALCILLPVLVLLCGIFVWLKRRNK